MEYGLQPHAHSATTEELRLRVIAQTNGDNAPRAQKALIDLHAIEARRRAEDDRIERQRQAP